MQNQEPAPKVVAFRSYCMQVWYESAGVLTVEVEETRECPGFLWGWKNDMGW